MSAAVFVHEVHKEYGSLYSPFLNRFPRRLSRRSLRPGKEGGFTGGENALQAAVVAIDRVSFTVEQGEIFGIAGPGGSGKTTLVYMLATLLLPDSGDIRIFGYDVVTQPAQVQRLINRVSGQASFFKKLSALDNLSYGASLDEISGNEFRSQVVAMLSRLGLDKVEMFQPMEQLSSTSLQKVAIARALLSRPRLLLLDEPTAGLESRAKSELQAILHELRDEHGTTIIITAKDRREAGNLCDRIALLDAGKIVALDTPERLDESFTSNWYAPIQEICSQTSEVC